MNTPTYSPNSAAVSPTNSATGAATPSATPTAGAKAAVGTAPKEEHKADVLREKVAETVEQLGRGWKSLSRLKDQIRRHPLATILSSTAILLAIGGSITVGVLESQRRRTFSYRFRKGLRSMKRQILR